MCGMQPFLTGMKYIRPYKVKVDWWHTARKDGGGGEGGGGRGHDSGLILKRIFARTSYISELRSCVKDIVQELCESRGGRPELSVLTSLLVSVDVKIY